MASTSYHLRPVATSPSPSPSNSVTPPSDSPQYKASTSSRPSPPAPGPTKSRRRRLSPSSLRDVDLSHAADMLNRNPMYPAPPTGHDLMAMFPPAPPDTTEMRAGSTSGYFQRQERAFFAQAGKEIVRVDIEIDLPHNERDKSRTVNSGRSWSGNGSPSMLNPPHHSPIQSSSTPALYPHPANRPPPQRGGMPPATLFPINPSPTSQMPPNLHPSSMHQPPTGMRTPPQDSNTSGPSSKEYSPDEYDDEAWRKPMPHAERRRAGKHTRRVIVRP